MNASVEERLRRALAHQAATTTTAPDGWRRIRARIEGRRLLRPGFARWGVLAPAAAVGVVVMIVAAVLAGSGDDGRVHVAGGPGRLYLAPTGVDGSFHLLAAGSDPQTPSPAGHYRAYGRRAADGVALEASAVIVVPGDFALIGAIPEPQPLQVLGRDLTVSGDDAGTRTLSWAQADGRSVAVITFGLSQPDLVVLAESLLRAEADTAAPALPPGFVAIRDGALADGLPNVSFSTWEAAPGRRFTVNVSDVPAISVDDLAWWLPGGRATKVRGTTAIYAAHPEGALAWIERPGTTVSVYATGMSEKELTTIAENLRPVDAAAWRDLVARAPGKGPGVPIISGSGPGGPPPPPPTGPSKLLTADNSYFLIQPVQGRSAPPCPAASAGPLSPTVAERRDGQDVACFQVGPPALDAGDVATATARQNRGTGLWEVEFTLTAEGAARFGGLAREVGAGGQIVIRVDGQVVSAPGLGNVAPTTTGMVTGLDEQTARRLADRLKK